MRMRKLGSGQSVVFCESREIRLKILEASGKSVTGIIGVADVLIWCIRNTWSHTRRSVPLWAAQGLRHYRRSAACSESSVPEVPESVLEPEARSLDQRYGHEVEQPEHLLLQGRSEERFQEYSTELQAIHAKCKDFAITSFSNATLHEEQERELAPENERERQVELPPATEPLKHRIHRDVRELVLSGTLLSNSTAFQPAFAVFDEMSGWDRSLLVTLDFAQTVRAGSRKTAPHQALDLLETCPLGPAE